MSRDRALNLAHREAGARTELPRPRGGFWPSSYQPVEVSEKAAPVDPRQNRSADRNLQGDRWALALYGFLCILLAIAHQGRSLELVFFAGAIVVAFLLLRHSFARYLSFVIWLYFLAPEVRRLADYFRGEFSAQSLIMVTPLFVSIMSAAYLPANRKLLFQRRGVAVLLTVSGILYGYFVGVVRSGVLAASYDLVNWAFPLLPACGLLIGWDSYEEIRRAVVKALLLGGVVISAYGVAQYINPPLWDAFWLASSGMLTQGVAAPFELRIFGTMNSSGPYSVALMCCVLVALSTNTRLALLCLVVSVPALFLTLVRSTVGGLAIGVVFLAFSLTGRQRRHLLVGTISVMLAVVPFTLMGGYADSVAQRMATVSDLKNDSSFEARSGVYAQFMDEMKVNVLGNGLGATGIGSKLGAGTGGIVDFDSGILEVPYVLGWPGSVLYGAGIVLFLARAIASCTLRHRSSFACACMACALGIVSLMAFTNTLVGPSGLFFFLFVTLPCVERRYRAAHQVEDGNGRKSSEPAISSGSGRQDR
jgi:hypothetical protein